MQQKLIETNTMSLVQYLEAVLNTIEQLVIFNRIGLYGNKKTLEQIGQILSVTRERIRQIQNRGLQKLLYGYESGAIFDSGYRTIENYAVVGTLLKDIDFHEQPDYGRKWYVQLMVEIFSSKYKLLKYNGISEPILTTKENDLESRLKKAEEYLMATSKLEDLGNVSSMFNISKEVLRGFDDIFLMDGKIGLMENTKVFFGKGSTGQVERELLKAGHPLSVTEISERTNLSETQVRGAVDRIPTVVNIGLSIYALTNWGYMEGTTGDVINFYLNEAQKPMTYHKIEKLVLKQRVVKKSTVQMVLQTDKRFQQLATNEWVLTEWGYENIKECEMPTKYAIPARKALLDVLNSLKQPTSSHAIYRLIMQKYGNQTSKVYGTYTYLLSSLVKDKKAIRYNFGTNVLYSPSTT